jgi:hypothetical protein
MSESWGRANGVGPPLNVNADHVHVPCTDMAVCEPFWSR